MELIHQYMSDIHAGQLALALDHGRGTGPTDAHQAPPLFRSTFDVAHRLFQGTLHVRMR